MNAFNAMNHFFRDPGLFFSLGLILIITILLKVLDLRLEKQFLYASFRGLIQLTLVGFILVWIFEFKSLWLIAGVLLIMTLQGANISKKNGKNIPRIFLIVFFSMLSALSLVLTFLVLGKAIQPEAKYLIPLGGMIIGNTMNGSGLTLNRLKAEISQRKPEILVYLSLGATPRQATLFILQSTFKAAMIPAIDTMKALGFIFMPGVMAGMIIGGLSPLTAARYQIIVMFMLLSASTITNLLVLELSYRQFFTPAMQLKKEMLNHLSN